MTHGHEVRWGNDGRKAVQGGGEERGEKMFIYTSI